MPPRRRPSAPNTPLLGSDDDMLAFTSSATDLSSAAASSYRHAFTAPASASSTAPASRAPLLGAASSSSRREGGAAAGRGRNGFIYRSKSASGQGLIKVRDRLQMLYNGRREARTRFAWFATAVVVLTWFALKRIRHFGREAPIPCDALHQPGRLLVNLTSPLHTHWRPLADRQCPPLPKYLPALWQVTHGPDRDFPHYRASTFSNEYQRIAAERLPLKTRLADAALVRAHPDPIPFLRRRRAHPPTVLVIGDSVDRNGLVQFCQLFRRNVTISHYHDISRHPPGPYPLDLTKEHGPKFDGWDQRGLMHRCELPFADGSGVALRVINGFHYGMDALDEFNTPDHNDWHAPGKVETRIDQLFLPAIEQLGGVDKIDVVQLHSGMWDLALFGMQDDKTRWLLTTPLTPEQLAWWQERMRHAIDHVRQRFPKARIVLRKLHRTDDAVAGTQYITNCASSTFAAPSRSPRSRRRVHQLRHLQEEVARSEGLPIFDFGHVLEGYQLFQEKVHPLLVPGGVVYAHNIVHQLRLALESRKSWRRGWLWDS
ncbi:hypothetical protein JCM8208_001870 [Rhodotorula glutinis]